MENKTKENCEQLEDLLVDYADDQLDPDECSTVAGHLRSCSNCRAKVGALNKSLELTRIIFQDNLSQIDDTGPAVAKSGKIKWKRLAWAAAAVLLAAGGLLTFHAQQTRPVEQTITASSIEEIDREINRALIAAKLLATAELMAESADNQNMVQKQYYHIAKTYPNTAAAQKAKLLIK
jgi:predicted anti-sigma-YlaC factor YlaD